MLLSFIILLLLHELAIVFIVHGLYMLLNHALFEQLELL